MHDTLIDTNDDHTFTTRTVHVEFPCRTHTVSVVFPCSTLTVRVVFPCSTLTVRVVFPCSTRTLHANYTHDDVKKLLGGTVQYTLNESDILQYNVSILHHKKRSKYNEAKNYPVPIFSQSLSLYWSNAMSINKRSLNFM